MRFDRHLLIIKFDEGSGKQEERKNVGLKRYCCKYHIVKAELMRGHGNLVAGVMNLS
jgi:hypothetical protein